MPTSRFGASFGGQRGAETRKGPPSGVHRGVEILRRGSVTNSIRRGLVRGGEGSAGRGRNATKGWLRDRLTVLSTPGLRDTRYEGNLSSYSRCAVFHPVIVGHSLRNLTKSARRRRRRRAALFNLRLSFDENLCLSFVANFGNKTFVRSSDRRIALRKRFTVCTVVVLRLNEKDVI